MAFEHEKTVKITKNQAPWAPDEEIGEYHITRWRWYDKQRALTESAEIIDEARDKAILNMAEYYARMFRICVVPPNDMKWDLERIKALDPEVGGILMEVLREINGLDWKEKRSFLEPSDQTKATPG